MTGFFVGIPLVFLGGRHLPRNAARRRAWVLGVWLPPFALVLALLVPTRFGRPTSKAVQTRPGIVDAAMTLFRTGGYDATTMGAIADEAGVSLGSAYYYFSGKEELVPRRAVERSDLKLAPALREELPELLWLLHMGIVLFWLYDASEGQRRTRTLVARIVPIIDRSIRLTRLPVVMRLVDDALGLVRSLRSA